MTVGMFNQGSIDHICRNLICGKSEQRSCFLFLAESIRYADFSAPSRWGLTLTKNYVRLNAGMIEVFALFPGSVHCMLHFDSVPKELREDNRVTLNMNINDPSQGIYKSVPGSLSCDVKATDFVTLSPLFHVSHLDLVHRASLTRRNPVTKKAHCGALINYLSSYIEQDIPQPSYYHETSTLPA